MNMTLQGTAVTSAWAAGIFFGYKISERGMLARAGVTPAIAAFPWVTALMIHLLQSKMLENTVGAFLAAAGLTMALTFPTRFFMGQYRAPENNALVR